MNILPYDSFNIYLNILMQISNYIKTRKAPREFNWSISNANWEAVLRDLSSNAKAKATWKRTSSRDDTHSGRYVVSTNVFEKLQRLSKILFPYLLYTVPTLLRIFIYGCQITLLRNKVQREWEQKCLKPDRDKALGAPSFRKRIRLGMSYLRLPILLFSPRHSLAVDRSHWSPEFSRGSHRWATLSRILEPIERSRATRFRFAIASRRVASPSRRRRRERSGTIGGWKKKSPSAMPYSTPSACAAVGRSIRTAPGWSGPVSTSLLEFFVWDIHLIDARVEGRNKGWKTVEEGPWARGWAWRGA